MRFYFFLILHPSGAGLDQQQHRYEFGNREALESEGVIRSDG